MTISRSSWHYRFYSLPNRLSGTSIPLPKSLCAYFWTIVVTPLALFGLAFGWALSWPLRLAWRFNETLGIVVTIAVVSSALTAWGFLQWQSLSVILGICAGVVIGTTLVGVAVAVVLDLRDKRRNRQAGMPESDSALRLAWAFLKTRKRKICPLIEVSA